MTYKEILEIIKSYKIKISLIKEMWGAIEHSYVKGKLKRVMLLPRKDCKKAMLIAFHELGHHLMHKNFDLTNGKKIIQEEYEAWFFALLICEDLGIYVPKDVKEYIVHCLKWNEEEYNYDNK